jgi:hypothetical protein
MADLRTGFGVVCRTDDALNGVVQNNVGDLVAGQECSDKCSPVDSDDKDLFCRLPSELSSTKSKQEL